MFLEKQKYYYKKRKKEKLVFGFTISPTPCGRVKISLDILGRGKNENRFGEIPAFAGISQHRNIDFVVLT
ncbi:MAG: hypothetical protein B6I23_02955 [Rickettsiaceae bacterium 4572_127]|nr:MAG: hypothetical protein B6I23_02955 [Rickettsiaceae bacterium 4572_127]